MLRQQVEAEIRARPVGKTDKMRLLELRHETDIRDLVFGGTVREAAQRLGVHYSVISKWRARLRHET